jgi:hypothetical protein
VPRVNATLSKYNGGKTMDRQIIQAIITLSMVFGIVFQAQSQSQDWEANAQKKVDTLIKKNGPGTDVILQKRLLEMIEEDQAIRRKLFQAPSDKEKELQKSLEAVDRKLTEELKEIIQKHGWPTIRLVGIKASQAAATILNHSVDHDFQRELIPELTKMVEQDEIVGSDIPSIIDKLLLSEGKPQLFGTVFRFEGEFMIMEPVKDPEHIDKRRAQYLIPPMEEYIKMMEEVYNKKLK